MADFRFGIMGPGNIAGEFVKAVRAAGGCVIAAVASKSAERAESFAAKNGIPAYYGSYEEMLEKEELDAVYISTVPSFHAENAKLCIEHGIPFLCEKAAFRTGAEAREVFAKAEAAGVFGMEAMWSRFMPAYRKAKEWLDEGKIGRAVWADAVLGFAAGPDPQNRFRNKAIGGGAIYDITVYDYEMMKFFFPEKEESMEVTVNWTDTDVDGTEHIVMRCPDRILSMTTSIESQLDEHLEISGTLGRIFLPAVHVARRAELILNDGTRETFEDDPDYPGFVHEIREVMECVRAGKLESEVNPHSLTIDCADMFDRVLATRR